VRWHKADCPLYRVSLFGGYSVGTVADLFGNLFLRALLTQWLPTIVAPKTMKSVAGVAAVTIVAAPLFWHILDKVFGVLRQTFMGVLRQTGPVPFSN